MENRGEIPDSDTNFKLKRRRMNGGNIRDKSIGKVSVGKDLLDEVVSFVKSNRARALSQVERMDILLLQAYLRHEHEEKQKKMGSGQQVTAPKISKTIAKMLRRKESLVKNVWT